MQLIETLKALDGTLFHLEYHQSRFERSLKKLGAETVPSLGDVLDPPDDGLIRCRVLYDEKQIIQVTYHPYIPRPITALQAVVDNTVTYALKSADRHLDRLFLQRGAADDILIIKNGLVTDTTIANIAFFDGEKWATPSSPLLMGTTRQRLLDEHKIIEQEIRVEDMSNFGKVALMNAMLGFYEIKNAIIPPHIKAQGTKHAL